MVNERVCVGAGVGGGVFVLSEHEPVSQEKKMTTRMDGRSEEEEKQKGKTETGCMSRIRIRRADIAVFRPVLQKKIKQSQDAL